MPDKEEKPQKRSRHWIKISLIVLLAITLFSGLIFSGIFIYKNLLTIYLSSRSETSAYVSVIKDASAEISYARSIKNNYNAANDATFAMQSISANYPDSVGDYAISVFNWGKVVSEAAGNKDISNSPESPDTFKLSLTNKDALDVYSDILSDVDRLKTFGDYSLAKENRDEMRWIAAHLQSEQIILDGLTNVTITDSNLESNNVALAATKYGPACYYGRGHVLVFSGVNKGDCLKKLSTGLDPVRKAAQQYASGKADDANDWNAGWEAIGGMGVPISTTGVTVGDNNFATPPAMVAFQDACKAKGGNSPAGATMDRLPISESGQICAYKGPQGGFCWDFQTDSGKSFSGGDPDCSHINLLPVNTKVPNPQPSQNGSDNSASVESPRLNQPNTQPSNTSEPTAEPQPTGQNFDGTYSGNGSTATGITNATVTVSGKTLSGTGTFVGPYNAQIGISISGSVDASGNVSGRLSGSGTVAGYDVSGSGTFSGKINGNTMSISYNVSGSGGDVSQSYSGSLNLSK